MTGKILDHIGWQSDPQVMQPGCHAGDSDNAHVYYYVRSHELGAPR